MKGLKQKKKSDQFLFVIKFSNAINKRQLDQGFNNPESQYIPPAKAIKKRGYDQCNKQTIQ
jgi:hypothetical protein